MTYKHKTHSVGADGKTISNADVDFYIDDVGHLLFSFILNPPCIFLTHHSLCSCRIWFMLLNPKHPSNMAITFCVKLLRFVNTLSSFSTDVCAPLKFSKLFLNYSRFRHLFLY